jgi:cell pole-organizing protein PopZ
MADKTAEPSMEEILSSIKMIIAEDDAKAAPAPRQKPRADSAAGRKEASDPVLDPSGAVQSGNGASIVSPDALAASRQALSSLSRLVVKPEVAGSDTLEGLVREMLKPMLKDWLDTHLPDIVERVVAQEVARITGQEPG